MTKRNKNINTLIDKPDNSTSDPANKKIELNGECNIILPENEKRIALRKN